MQSRLNLLIIMNNKYVHIILTVRFSFTSLYFWHCRFKIKIKKVPVGRQIKLRGQLMQAKPNGDGHTKLNNINVLRHLQDITFRDI